LLGTALTKKNLRCDGMCYFNDSHYCIARQERRGMKWDPSLPDVGCPLPQLTPNCSQSHMHDLYGLIYEVFLDYFSPLCKFLRVVFHAIHGTHCPLSAAEQPKHQSVSCMVTVKTGSTVHFLCSCIDSFCYSQTVKNGPCIDLDRFIHVK